MASVSSATLTNPAPQILFLCAGDPESDRAFSGSAKGMASALERAGAIHHKANVLGITDPFNTNPSLGLRLARKFDRGGFEIMYRYSELALRRNSARAQRIARDHPGYDACFMYGTSFNPPFDVPTYCYFDATVAQVAAEGAWEFATLSERAVALALKHQKSVFERCTAIFPRTEYTADSVEKDSGIPREKIVPTGAGANFHATPLPHTPYDRRNILFIGVEFERKGGPLLVEAFRRVRRKIPDATLTIVGCSPDIKDDGVEVLGRISKTEPAGLTRLLELYSQASVFSIMSHYEPFGIVFMEAQICGVPCVAPRRFAFPEMIRDGETGRLVNEYDAEELADTLTTLLQDEKTLKRMGTAATQFMQEQWTWDRAAERVLNQIGSDLGKISIARNT